MFISQEQALLLNGRKGIIAYAWIPASDSLLLKKIGPILLKKQTNQNQRNFGLSSTRNGWAQLAPVFSLKKTLTCSSSSAWQPWLPPQALHHNRPGSSPEYGPCVKYLWFLSFCKRIWIFLGSFRICLVCHSSQGVIFRYYINYDTRQQVQKYPETFAGRVFADSQEKCHFQKSIFYPY